MNKYALLLLLVGLITGITAYIMYKKDPSTDTLLFKALGFTSIITLTPFVIILGLHFAKNSY